jgi:hypothetical protein
MNTLSCATSSMLPNNLRAQYTLHGCPSTSLIGAHTSNFDPLLWFVNAGSGGISEGSAWFSSRIFLLKCFHMTVNKEHPSHN